MSASFSKRILTFVPVIAGLVFFAGCSPEALDLGEVTPPQPLPDPSITTSFAFEANQMPEVTNGSFTIGNAPLTATFSGGSVQAPANTELYRSPTQAWLIEEGGSASITFETPASSFEFWYRNEFAAPEEEATRGGEVACNPPADRGLNPAEAFGAEIFVRGSFNNWGNDGLDGFGFVNLGEGVYQAIFELSEGTTYKIADEGWNGPQYVDADTALVVDEPRLLTEGDTGPGADGNIGIDEPGCYSWTITVTDSSAIPAPEVELIVEPFTGGVGNIGSFVTVYDVLGEVIFEDFGDPFFKRLSVERDTDGGDTLISRVEIENIAGAARRSEEKESPTRGGTCPGIGSTENPATAFGAEMFARGEFNDWADPVDVPYNFINNGDGTYSAQFDLAAGTYAYKLASQDWSIQYADTMNATVVGTAQALSEGDTGTENGSITIDADGCYDWLLSNLDTSATPAPGLDLLVTPFVPDEGTPGESGVGFTAIDDFRFSAVPQTEPRAVTLFYVSPDGDYSGTVFNITGDVVGGDQSVSCEPAADGFGCTVTVMVQPGGTLSYIVSNNDVPDESGQIDVGFNQIVGEEIYTFSGSSVPLLTGLPVAPQENEVILFYKRDDDVYDGWGLHLFPISTPDWTYFSLPEGLENPPEAAEYPPAGVDPQLGAYFIIALPGSDRLTEPYSRCVDTSVEGCDLDAFPESLGFLIHKGDSKDPGPDQFVRIAADGNIIFVRSGVNSVSSTPPVDGGVAVAGAAAHWVAQDTVLWDAPGSVDSVQLLFSADGGIREAGGRLIGADMSFDLDAGTSPSLPNSTHLEGLAPWAVPGEALEMIDMLITGQLLVLGLDADGNQVEATAVQIPLVLDDLYAANARDAGLGVNYSGGVPQLALWAPTSTMVSVNIFDTATAEAPSDTLPMTYEPDSGIWTITGTSEWDRKYYTYTVTNFVPLQARVREQEVTDPYSINIAMGGTSMQRSQFVNLDDADLKPADWDTFVKPELEAPEDIVIYELHVRDFSAVDPSVLAGDQGKYTAFAGAGSGTTHLADLAAAGLTHVHILPAFDIASVNEDPTQRVDLNDPIADLCALNPAAQSFCDVHSGTILEALESYDDTASEQQELVNLLRGFDSFNWGYDPVHFNTPEGTYASDANNESRVLEFRQMVKGLSDIGLRTVLDQVYNHTNASGTSTNAIFDKVVPGYYHRYDAETGLVLRETCCDDTAAEHAMMEKFLVDSMEFWAKQYKIDGFRLDLMSFHPLSTMEIARDRLQALTVEEDGVDGSDIYIYGEGWNTGIAENDSRFTAARQDNLAGTGIGSFNDRIRDAVRGGGPFDTGSGHIDSQGFISGQFYDPNANNSGTDSSGLLGAADRIRVAMAGALANYPLVDAGDNSTTGSGIGAGYTSDPQEIVNYVASHDGETLWDISQFKHPTATTTADRVRAHNLGNAIVLLGQGVPFLHAGQDLLRSKSMDRNSFDSGDWFNYLDFSANDNNFAVGLPPEGDNADSYTVIGQVLANPAALPGAADIMFARDVTRELLQIRKSSDLFRLRTSGDVVNRVVFHNTGSAQVPGMIVMSIDGCVTPEYTPEYGSVVVVINARTDAQVFDLFAERSYALHPVQASSVDSVVATASHDASGFSVPARTAAVFVEAQSGDRVCGFGADFAGSTPFVTGDFNGNAFVNAMIGVGNTSFIETTVNIPMGSDQRYRILSADSASINCGGPAGEGPLFTPFGDMASTLTCGAGPDELSLDSAMEDRYKFSLDTTNILSPSLTIREQAGTGFPIAGGGCGVADMGNDNAEFFGEEVFVRGGFNDWLNPPPPEYKLINTGSGIFQVEAEIMAGDWEFKVASADWGPEYTDPSIPVVLGMTQTVPLGEPGAANIAMSLAEDGCYNFTVVPSAELDADNVPVSLDMTVSQIPQDTGEPTAAPLVRGGFNDWGATDELTMVDATNFETILTVATAGSYEFKIAAEDWATVNCGGPQDLGAAMSTDIGAPTVLSCGGNPSNLVADFAVAGDYQFSINTANRNNPTLTVSGFSGAGFNSEGLGQPTVYLKGDFNSYGLDNPAAAAGGGNLYFVTVALTTGTASFRFESADGTTISCGTPTGDSSDVALGVATEIACGPAQSDLTVDVPADGNYQFSIDAGLSGSAINPILTVTQL
ncbi:MAG: pullulanase-type alpha-1,6-glucosidase [Gammaproteobacteria bacterium]|nr:pullulanase-type alpha-1,6-glucosidase [Gammaproteobacteria bacterium]